MTERIVVVEDDPFLREMYAKRLSMEGYQVLVARAGDEGLSLILKERPNLVLLDMMLPFKNGLQVLEALKTNQDTRDIPVVLLTAQESEEKMIEGLGEGAADYLAKAKFTPNQIVEKVKSTLAAAQAKILPFYRIQLKEGVKDAPRLAADFRFKKLFTCPYDSEKLDLQLIPIVKDGGNYFEAHFICPKDGRIF